jgi:hypothetical protein
VARTVLDPTRAVVNKERVVKAVLKEQGANWQIVNSTKMKNWPWWFVFFCEYKSPISSATEF